jgi:hypothetical protein
MKRTSIHLTRCSILTVPGEISLLHKIILFLLCLLISPMGNVAYGEVDGCTVGDDSQGYWVRAYLAPGECPIPGPPATDGQWFLDPDSGNWRYPFRIEGRYKIGAGMSGEGFALSPPPSRPGCIDGFAEAFTAWGCERYQSPYNYWNSVSPYTTTFTASSTLCIMVITGPNDYYHVQYLRYFDVGIVYYEWVCSSQSSEPSEENKNQGPPCPPDQCCE